MIKGDEVWWINGVGDRLTGILMESVGGKDFVLVWCFERNCQLRPPARALHGGGDHPQETTD